MKKIYEVLVTEEVYLKVWVEAESEDEAIQNWQDSNDTKETGSKVLTVESALANHVA